MKNPSKRHPLSLQSTTFLLSTQSALSRKYGKTSSVIGHLPFLKNRFYISNMLGTTSRIILFSWKGLERNKSFICRMKCSQRIETLKLEESYIYIQELLADQMEKGSANQRIIYISNNFLQIKQLLELINHLTCW